MRSAAIGWRCLPLAALTSAAAIGWRCLPLAALTSAAAIGWRFQLLASTSLYRALCVSRLAQNCSPHNRGSIAAVRRGLHHLVACSPELPGPVIREPRGPVTYELHGLVPAGTIVTLTT